MGTRPRQGAGAFHQKQGFGKGMIFLKWCRLNVTLNLPHSVQEAKAVLLPLPVAFTFEPVIQTIQMTHSQASRSWHKELSLFPLFGTQS